MLAVDRLRKSANSGLRRQSTTTTSSPVHSHIPAVELRTSSLARKSSNARFCTVDGPPTPTRRVHANTTATEIIHLRDDPVVVQPEVVAIQVSRSSSNWANAASDDDDGVTGGVSSSLTYESFRGPPSAHRPTSPAVPDVFPDHQDGFGGENDGTTTPTNEIDPLPSPHHNCVTTFIVHSQVHRRTQDFTMEGVQRVWRWKSPSEVQGQSFGRESGVRSPQKLKQNMKLMYNF